MTDKVMADIEQGEKDPPPMEKVEKQEEVVDAGKFNGAISYIPDNHRAVMYIHSYSKNSGGINVVYELARLIDGIDNWEAFIFDEEGLQLENDIYNKYIDTEDIDDNDIVVYPEVISGNPLNARHVVRWILCKPNVFHQSVSDTWGYNDKIMLFSSFDPNKKIEDENLMYCTTTVSIPEFGNVIRDKHRATIRKGSIFHTPEQIHEYIAGKDIIHNDFDEMIHLLSISKSFSSADPYTYWSFISAMCNTPSIVVPLEHISKSQWAHSLCLGYYLKNEFESDIREGIYYIQNLPYSLEQIIDNQPFGIAYGNSEEELEWSKQTMFLTELQQERSRLCGTRTVEKALKRFEDMLFSYRNTYDIFRDITTDEVKTVIMAFSLNEGDYLDEWVRHHIGIGVNHIHLIDDNSTDHTEEVLKPWVEKGLVTHHKWSLEIETKGQNIWDPETPYNVLAKRMNGQNVWLAGIDVDEFIVLDNNHQTISDVLRTLKKYPGVVMNWKAFGPEGRHLEPPPGSNVLDSYLHRFQNDHMISTHVKTWVNMSHPHWEKQPPYYRLSHNPSFEPNHCPFVDTRGKPALAPFNKPVYTKACIHHYMYKSYEYYRKHKSIRYDKSKVSVPNYKGDYWEQGDMANVIYDESGKDPNNEFPPVCQLDWKDYCSKHDIDPPDKYVALRMAFTTDNHNEDTVFVNK